MLDEVKQYAYIEHDDDDYDELENNREMNKNINMDPDDRYTDSNGRSHGTSVNQRAPGQDPRYSQHAQKYNYDPVTGQSLTPNPTLGNRNLERIMGQISVLADKIDALSLGMNKVATLVQNNSLEARGMREELIQLDKLDQLEELKSVIDSQQAIIKSQHDASVKYGEDVIYKMQKPLIMELIGIADEIRMIMDSKRQDESYDLMDALRDLEESVEASLSNNSVRRFRESEDDDTTLDRRRQKVVERNDTSDPALDGHYVSYSPGYEWTMPYLVVNSEVKLKKIIEENRVPQVFSLVIRPEEVVKLKYRPEEAETTASTEPTEETTESED